MKIKFAISLLCAVIMSSCSDDEIENAQQNAEVTTQEATEESADSLKADFAQSLSAALSDSPALREFLKSKALEQFDRNYDVLYLATEDENVGGATFRDLMSAYMPDEKLTEIEARIPLLNIYLTRIAPLGVYPEDLDTSDDEIPTAVVMEDSTRIFVAGQKVEALAKGEVPDFHIFVVGENRRVVLDDASCGSLKSASIARFRFKDPVFDGMQNAVADGSLKSLTLTNSELGSRAIESYKYFYKDDNGIYQKALQRDYIYYGITPQSQKGALNHSVSEHICKIKVDPKAFFKIRDHVDDKDLDKITREDPDIIKNEHLSVGHETSTEDLINIMWSQGVYDFRFDVVKSNEGTAESVYVPARPEEIWEFNIEYWYRHKTKFRHSRHHYSIDPEKFTAKEFNPTSIPNLGKWNIADEALYRYINIYEEDNGTEVEDKYSYEMAKVKSTHFSGDLKLSIGLKKVKVENDYNLTTNKSETETVKREVVVKRKDTSDFLGKVAIYYYDPIIEGVENGSYKIHEYNTGLISFCVVAY